MMTAITDYHSVPHERVVCLAAVTFWASLRTRSEGGHGGATTAAAGAKSAAATPADSGGSRLGGFSAAEPEPDSAAADDDTPAAADSKPDVVSHELSNENSSTSIGSDDHDTTAGQGPLAAAAAAVCHCCHCCHSSRC